MWLTFQPLGWLSFALLVTHLYHQSLLVTGLVSGKYDVIFSHLSTVDPAITVMPLFREPLRLVVNAKYPLAKYKSIKANQLAGLHFYPSYTSALEFAI